MLNKCPTTGKVGRIRTLAGTIRRSLVRLKSLMTQGIGKRRITLKKRNGSNAEYHLTLKQIEKIINASQCLRNRVLIQILAFTGIRRAEVVALEVNDILWKEKLLIIRFGKGNKQRLAPLPDFVLVGIQSLIGQRTTGAVFLSRIGQELSCRQLNRIVAKAGKDAGVNNPNPKYGNITCHLFRHSFARHWKDKHSSMESLSKILGHEDQSTTLNLYGAESLKDVQRNYNAFIKKLTKHKTSMTK